MARSSPSVRGRPWGFTLLEVLVAVAVIGVLATVGAAWVRPAAALRAASAARALLLTTRLEAMWTGRAVAVLPDGSRGLLTRRAATAGAAAACGGRPGPGLDLRRYGPVRVETPFRSGIAWLPTGGARSCSGGGVISGTMVVADARTRVGVVVSSLGRVRIEPRP